MKQLFSLLALFALTVTSYAQSNEEKIERSRDIILGKDQRTETDRSRDVVLGRRSDDRGIYESRSSIEINREYDRKIRQVRNNPDLTRAEKERIIKRMEQERRDRLRKINSRDRDYDRNRDRDYDRDRDRDRDDRYGKNKKVKGNNGKHLGWEKGKGNQKKNKNGRKH